MNRPSKVEQAGSAVTSIGKLAGYAVALNEVFTQATIRPGALILAALLITGAEGLERAMKAFGGTK